MELRCYVFHQQYQNILEHLCDIISGADPSILYYYDVSGVATNTAGKINFT